MSTAQPIKAPPPSGCLLEAYQQPEHYVDAFVMRVDGEVAFADFVTAFYCSPRFRPERWLLGLKPSMRSSNAHARALGAGLRDEFAAWLVEARRESELLLIDRSGRTRSWLMASPKTTQQGARQTALYFGSAVVDVAEAPPRWFRATLGFHVRYSQKLLASAVKTLPKVTAQETTP